MSRLAGVAKLVGLIEWPMCGFTKTAGSQKKPLCWADDKVVRVMKVSQEGEEDSVKP